MSISIVPIVEGKGEVIAVPILLRRILQEEMHIWDIDVAKPVLAKRNLVVKEGKLEERIKIALTDRDHPGAVLILLDTDPDDCPAQIGPTLRERALKVTHLPVAVVLANLEFKAWFLGAKESLRGHCGIRDDVEAPVGPETIRGAKESLSRNMIPGRRYLPIADQASLCSKLDLQVCRSRCPSFDKLIRDITNLVAEIKNRSGVTEAF